MKGDAPLSEHADFMGNRIIVGDSVIVVRVPDRTPQMYTAEVVAMKLTPTNYGASKLIPKIQVMPTGGYSTPYGKHGDYTSQGVKPVWVGAEHVLKYPPETA